AGVTSGVVALILDAHTRNGFRYQDALTPNEVKAFLQYSAIRVADADYMTQGAGEINAAGATALAGAIDTSRSFGSWWLARGLTPSSVISGQAYPWSQRVIWGDTVLGANAV